MLGFGDFMFGRTGWQAPTATWISGTGANSAGPLTLTGLNIGPLNVGSDDRIVIVGVWSENSSDTITPTVNSISGTAVGVTQSIYGRAQFFAFYDIASTTANVSVSFGLSTNHTIGVWTVIYAGGSAAVYTGAYRAVNNTNGPIYINITPYANGVILGMANKGGSPSTPNAWTGTNAPATDATVNKGGSGSNRYGHLNNTTAVASSIGITGSDSNKSLTQIVLCISAIPFY
jgi:hypothetical protein